MYVSPAGGALSGALYNAANESFTPATDLRSMTGIAFTPFAAAIDPVGRAVLSWSGATAGYGWSRYTAAGTWVDAGTFTTPAWLAVSSEGQAMAYWAQYFNGPWLTRDLDLSNGSVGPDAPTTVTDEWVYVQLVSSLERMALLSTGSEEGISDLTVEWKNGSGWSTRQPLATAAFTSINVDSDEEGNIIVVWSAEGELWSRVYQRAMDTWSPAAFLAAVPPNAIVYRPDMTAGNAVVSFTTGAPDPGTWAAVYQSGVGWVESSIVKLDPAWVAVNGPASVALDAAGNALVFWHSQGKFRRYLAGTGWLAPSSLAASLAAQVWAVGAADGSVLAVSTEMNAGAVVAPWAARFE